MERILGVSQPSAAVGSDTTEYRHHQKPPVTDMQPIRILGNVHFI